jgi:antitoxin component YwqK of YwqJK toxin-antitoxin module
MKYLLFILIAVAAGCQLKQKKNSIDQQVVLPDVFIETTDSALHNVNGTWWLKGQKYNGYIIEKNNNILVAKLPVAGGKENGTAYGWFINGHKKYERRFLNGNREGIQRGWYKNDTMAFQYFFHNDKFEGVQRTFFESGHIWQSLGYVNGYEEGKQKSYNDSGRVINNFTIKNKKLYGVIGRYDCMSVYKK